MVHSWRRYLRYRHDGWHITHLVRYSTRGVEVKLAVRGELLRAAYGVSEKPGEGGKLGGRCGEFSGF